MKSNKALFNNLKIYHVFWIAALLLLLTGIALDQNIDNRFTVNVKDIYYVIAYLDLGILLSLYFLFLGIGYWIVQKFMRRKLIQSLTILHLVILFGSLLAYGLILTYEKIFLADDFTAFNSYEIIEEIKMISVILLVFFSQPIYAINILIGIFRERKLV